MIQYVVVSLITFVQVLLLVIQTRNSVAGRTGAVVMTSVIIATLVVFLQRQYLHDDIAAVCWIVSGAIGAGVGVELHKKMFRKKGPL